MAHGDEVWHKRLDRWSPALWFCWFIIGMTLLLVQEIVRPLTLWQCTPYVLECLSTVKWILGTNSVGIPSWISPGVSSLKNGSCFYVFELYWEESCYLLSCLKGIVLLIFVQNSWFLFNDTNLFNNHTCLGPSLHISFYSDLYTLNFVPESHCKLGKSVQQYPYHSLTVCLPWHFLHKINTCPTKTQYMAIRR